MSTVQTCGVGLGVSRSSAGALPVIAADSRRDQWSARERLDHAQRLRLKRTLLGVVTHMGGSLIVVACYVTGILGATQLANYLMAITAVCGTFVALILTNANLRFRDPSMTAAQVIVTMWPACYVMFHVTEPQARVPFLLMGTVGVLFGMFALDFRGLLLVSGGVMASYGVVITSLALWAPARVDLRIEAVSVFAFMVVLLLVTYIGSYMAGLRRTVQERNTRLGAVNAHLEQVLGEMHTLATRDHLTGLPNRRVALEHLAQETGGSAAVKRLRGGGGVVCVGLLDIDHFKRVNDTYGHQTGDQVLCAVSDILVSSLRQGDFVGRYGGEEFLLIFTATTADAAHKAAERVRQAVGQCSLPDLPVELRVSASMGLSFYRVGETLDANLERTDAALYKAKQQGRDCTVLDG